MSESKATLFEDAPALPNPEALEKGLSIARVFSQEGEHPFDTVTWEKRDAAIHGTGGKAIFEQKGVEFPTTWSQLATNVVASKYFYGDLASAGADPAEGGREHSLKQLIHRVTRTIADWGAEGGYFATEEDAEAFYDELTWLCTHQYGAFNSPVWFNVGLGQQYGIQDTGGKTIFGWDFQENKVVTVDPYERPQASACFIISVEDSIDDIWSLMAESARLFKFGSGVGADWSTLRSTKEKLSGGGIPSGPVSFMKVQDETGATIKSGGKTRRAAIMQTLKCWHPDVMEFVEAKQTEEKKAWALIEQGYDGSFNGPAYGSVAFQNVNQSLRVTDAFMEAAAKGEAFELRAVTTGETVEEVEASEILRKVAEGTHVCGDPGLQYEDTIQKWHTAKSTGPINSSNPCCFTGDAQVMTDEGAIRFDALFERYEALRTRHGARLASLLLPRTRTAVALASAAGSSDAGRPDAERLDVRIKRVWVAGLADTLTEVRASNGAVLRSTPDHRYLTFDGAWVEAQHLEAGVRLVAGLDGAGPVYVESVQEATLDAPVEVYDLEVDSGLHSFSVTSAGSAAGVVVHNSEYMHLDNSACNLASLNLRKYQREDGSFDVERFRAAARIYITAQEILVDQAGYPSREIAKNSHAFRPLGLGFANLGALLMSMGLPYDSDEGRAVAGALTAIEHCEAYARSAEIAANKKVGPFPGFKKNRAPMLEVMHLHRDAVQDIDPACPDYLRAAAQESADRMVALGERHGYRNAQATVLAPTGTIGFMMDCDTTGIEPDIALVKYKLLAGAGDGVFKIVNQTVPLALERLGYSPEAVEAIIEYIDENDTIEGAPDLKDEHLPVFDCAFQAAGGERSIHHLGHIKMMGACQPFISGAISKTVNMPEHSTVEDIADAYLQSWKEGLKAVAIYRENSKRSQPLSTKAGGNTQKAKEALDASGDGALTPEPEVRVEEKIVYKPVRRRLPDERPSITHKFSIAGHEGYLTIGLYPDKNAAGRHQPGEIFITMAKQGSTLAGMMDAFATSISIALQYGVPLTDLVSKFSHMRFEPSGFTNNKQVPMAKSIMDYIFRYLSIKFLDDPETKAEEAAADPTEAVAAEARRSGPAEDAEQGELPLDADPRNTDATMEEMLDTPTAEAPESLVGQTVEAFMAATDAAIRAETSGSRPASGDATQSSFQNQADAPPCSNCGSITVRNGACYQCLNCGSSTGCG